MAINRRELADVLNYPDGVPILDALTTRRQFQQGLYPEAIPYDPERASRLLEAEGWRDIDGNGILDRAGEEFRFTAIVNSNHEKIAIYVQDRFRRIGIRMEIQILDNAIVIRHLRTGQFEAVITVFTNSDHIRMLGENSPFGYANPEMIRLLNLAVETINPNEKDRIYREIMSIFRANLPITLLFPQVQTHIVQRRIKGLSSPWRADPVWNMEYLWLEDED